jgi:hypothetical protein
LSTCPALGGAGSKKRGSGSDRDANARPQTNPDPVRIDIRGGKWAEGLLAIRKERFGCERPRVPNDKADAITRVIFIALAYDQKASCGLAHLQAENSSEVSFLRLIQARLMGLLEASFTVIAQDRKCSSAAGSNGQVLPAISIEVLPGERRPELAESIGKKRLAGEIIECGLHVPV